MEPPDYEELASVALDALKRAAKAECSVCGSDYHLRFFAPEAGGVHRRVRHTKHSRAIGNTERRCAAAAIHAQRKRLFNRLLLNPDYKPF